MADKKDADTKQASNMLLCNLHILKAPYPFYTVSLKHCCHWEEGGIAVFYTKTLINVVFVHKKVMHMLNLWDQLG
eukprot:15334762-Ditylum_brightwellii.AAC.1